MMQVMHGKLTNYRCNHTHGYFLLNEREADTAEGVMGFTAVLAAMADMADMAGQAASTASNSDTSEPADEVHFTLNGIDMMGHLWFSPFNDGDDVTAVVQEEAGRYIVYALLRPRDRLIALYPHCSRGRWAHWKGFLKSGFKGAMWFNLSAVVFFGLINAFMSSSWLDWLTSTAIIWGGGAVAMTVFIMLFTISTAVKWMQFVRLAESIFTTLGWEDVRNIDLKARSKATPLDTSVSFVQKALDKDKQEDELLALYVADNDEYMIKHHKSHVHSACSMVRSSYGVAYYRY
jgi:hypothetical protein